jgi:hypothetical protein
LKWYNSEGLGSIVKSQVRLAGWLGGRRGQGALTIVDISIGPSLDLVAWLGVLVEFVVELLLDFANDTRHL